MANATYIDSETLTSVSFKLLLSAPAIDAEASVDVRHIPGGDQSYIDLGGQSLNTWEAEGLFFTYADFQAMAALTGRQGTLEYTEDITSLSTTTLDVVLRKVGRKRVTGRGPSFANLGFTLL